MLNYSCQVICAMIIIICSPVHARQWDKYIFVGARTTYAPASQTALVGEISFRRPLMHRDYLYHQAAMGLWSRRELILAPDIIYITPPPLSVVTTLYGSYSIGIQSDGPFYTNFSHGIGLINKPTAHLGTYYQFFTSIGIGYSASDWHIECGLRHLSNGSRYTGTSEINAGEDFWLCGTRLAL